MLSLMLKISISKRLVGVVRMAGVQVISRGSLGVQFWFERRSLIEGEKTDAGLLFVMVNSGPKKLMGM